MPSDLIVVGVVLLGCCEQEMGNQISIKFMTLSCLFFFSMNFNAYSSFKYEAAVHSSCLIIDKCIFLDWAWIIAMWL